MLGVYGGVCARRWGGCPPPRCVDYGQTGSDYAGQSCVYLERSTASAWTRSSLDLDRCRSAGLDLDLDRRPSGSSATPRHGHASTGHATPGCARTRHNRRERARPTSGRPDARVQHGASYARAGETCTILHHSGHKKTRAALRRPGFACLAPTYRRRMRIRSVAR